MSAPQRIQRKRTKGWKMPEGAVYVGRPTKWGNPFRVGDRTRLWHTATTHPYDSYLDCFFVTGAEHAVRLYRQVVLEPSEHWLDNVLVPTAAVVRAELAGKDLACWCPLDQPCHADVLLALANGTAS